MSRSRPQARKPRRFAFDSAGLHAEIKRVAQERGLSMWQVHIETGVDSATLSRMRSKGEVPDGINLASLARWSGIDVGAFSIDLEMTP